MIETKQKLLRGLSTSVVVASSLVAVACSSSDSDAPAKEQRQPISACNLPKGLPSASAEPVLGTCTPKPGFQGCEVPSGSVVNAADGTITTPDGEVAKCHALCAPSDFALTCASSPGSNPPPPAPALGCTVIPMPTPSGRLFYCCPCAN
ncbi:hypothetical protein AKJ09_07775 [Labilithrix luteola]|uniref:Lipoprotein n=1 Tax=Labilithrix luteola TaxID=1391654 RepID=A0A0K1Q619_9BACT|nr:hypothetical protein [Labilithrix luteola]AKV01112.1 hypothetical protein AKJ09_07775 [Labilithrix luteola]